MAATIVLQKLHGLSDRDTAEAVRCDLRWKVACGLSLTDNGFHPTTLLYWRRRLAASGRPNRIFDAVAEVIAATGALSGKTSRALDSTVLEDAVATQDTVTHEMAPAIKRSRRFGQLSEHPADGADAGGRWITLMLPTRLHDKRFRPLGRTSAVGLQRNSFAAGALVVRLISTKTSCSTWFLEHLLVGFRDLVAGCWSPPAAGCLRRAPLRRFCCSQPMTRSRTLIRVPVLLEAGKRVTTHDRRGVWALGPTHDGLRLRHLRRRPQGIGRQARPARGRASRLLHGHLNDFAERPRHRNCNVKLDDLRWDRPDLILIRK